MVHAPFVARSRVRGALELLATAAAFKLTADFAAAFAEGFGASYLFPPAAVVFVAGAAFGWVGVTGVLIGSLFSRWGAADTLGALLLFSLVHAATAAIPALALRRPRGRSELRVATALAFGIVLANLFNAAAGTLVLLALGNLAATPGAIGTNLLYWWTSDFTAALVLGLPLALLLRPETLLDARDGALFRGWLEQRRQLVAILVLVFASTAVILIVGALGWSFPYWVAVTLIAPIGLAALGGGLAAALSTQLVVSIVFFVLFLGLDGAALAGETIEGVGPMYLQQVFFSAFALVGGLLAGRNRHLLEKVAAQRELIRQDFERIVVALSAAIEAKDPTTDGHVQRVARLAVEVGRRLGLREEALETLRYGALLHDVGKIGVPESVLNKAGPLTWAEREVIESHVEIGVRILSGIDVLAEVVPLVRYHQERWDGLTTGVRYSGYYGLAGEAIPVGARILAVVDTFDAITNDRPYRAGRSAAVALEELEREAGLQFDPAVVAALVALVEEEEGGEPALGELPAGPPAAADRDGGAAR